MVAIRKALLVEGKRLLIADPIVAKFLLNDCLNLVDQNLATTSKGVQVNAGSTEDLSPLTSENADRLPYLDVRVQLFYR